MASTSGPNHGAGAALSIVVWPQPPGWQARLRAGRLEGGGEVSTVAADTAELVRLVVAFVDAAATGVLPAWPPAPR